MYKSSTYKINRFKKIKKHNQVKQEINEGVSTWTWGHLTSEPGTHAGVESRQEVAGSAASGGEGGYLQVHIPALGMAPEMKRANFYYSHLQE